MKLVGTYHRCGITLLILSVFLSLMACNHRSHTAAGDLTEGHAEISKSFYTPPQPPATLPDSAQLVWLGEHYWDSLDYTDSTLTNNVDLIGPAFGNYLHLLLLLPAQQAAASIKSMLNSAATGNPAAFDLLIRWYEDALYDPNSPLRNEDLYIPVIEYIVTSPKVDSLRKIRPQYQLDMALKNRPGEVATDFAYTTPDGHSHRLSALKANYTLLFFYNPDCPACKDVKDYIVVSDTFQNWIGKGRLRVLAVYPDEDLKLWRKRLAQMPEGWVTGCDPRHRLTNDRLYDLKAIPTLYLLDKGKRVILKDAPVEIVEEWFNDKLNLER